MVFPVVGGTQDTSYDIENSVRFNDDDSAALSITPSSASTSRTKWTWSGWIKRGEVPTDDNNDYSRIFNVKADGNNYIISGFLYGNGFNVTAREGGSEVLKFEPSRKFRDHSAWYHIVMAYDSTQGTARNRFRVYFNGEEDTTALATTPDQNTELVVLEDVIHNIGRDNHGTAYYYDGYMADVYLIDGTQYAASDFGETNDNGVWIPKKFTGSFGTNGFKLEFKQTGTSQNSSGIGADTSGNDNHLAVTNLAATDITTDTPTNNFCTMNPLYSYSGITFSEGNLQTNLGGSNHRWGTSTFFVANGKWYFECKLLSDSNYNSGPGVIAYGISDPITTEGGGAGATAEGWIYLSTSAGDLQHGGTQYGTASAATTNDILMVAFDVDNGKIWIGKNGTWSEGSNPSTGNGAVREDLGDASSGLFSPGVSGYAENMVFNFGNPPFSISSGNADANGYGNFEYAVPSGFYSLCTKNLAEFG